jgi:hypothetical protein
MDNFIDIVFDKHEGHFVDIRNAFGESVKLGEWVELENGTWALRLREVDLQ